MSQLEPSFPIQGTTAPRTSVLAIASLVCSLLFCCPLATIPGMVLGVAALASIRADPLQRGRGLAITGIVLGVIFTVGQAVIYPKGVRLGMQCYELFNNGPQEALNAGFAGDLPAFRGRFHGAAATATDQEAQEFISQLRSRYGEFLSCRPNEQVEPAFVKSKVTAAYLLEFETATVQADIDLVLADPDTSQFVFKLGRITVIDHERGDLTYPPQPAEPQPPGEQDDGG